MGEGERQHTIRLTDPVEDPSLQPLLCFLQTKARALRREEEEPKWSGHPYPLLAQVVDEQIFPQCFRGDVERPAAVDAGHLVDKRD